MANALDWRETVRTDGIVHGWPDDNVFAPVHEGDIAAVAAQALIRGDLDGEALPVTGPEMLRPWEQVAVLAETLRRPFRFEPLSRDVALQLVAGMVGGHGAAQLLEALSGRDAAWRRPVPTVEQVVGRAARTWRDWCEAHVADFR